MENIKIITISIIYISIIIGIATAITRLDRGASEKSRKFVHILLGNWVFFTPFFTELWAIIIVPLVFIFVNSLSIKYKLISAIERNDDSLGTVYYAISMFVLAGAGFILKWPILPFIGILTMAYGDGLATIVGQKWGKRKPFSFAPEKTIAGSMTVGLVSFFVTLVVLFIYQGRGNINTATLPMIFL